MPRLLPVLEGLRVVSARSTYERFYPGAPLCWKAAAFAHEANQAFGDDPQGAGPREIISFGDSNEERTAVKIASGQLGAVAKSVKFVDMPTPEQLCKQVETVCGWLKWVVDGEAELDLMLKASMGDALGSPLPMEGSADPGSQPWRPPPMEELRGLEATA